MKMFRNSQSWNFGFRLCTSCMAAALLAAPLSQSAFLARAQAPTQASLAERVQQLSDAMARTQAQLETSQRELEEMRRQLGELRLQIAQGGPPVATQPTSAAAADPSLVSPQESSKSDSAIQDLREHQEIQDSQIATQEQTKVESDSKYPLKVTGMLLLNAFKNTSAVDMAANPSVATGGSGSLGASVRQTILGFDAHGPHIFGASSFADLRVDFYGSQAASASTTSYSGYDNAKFALLRLRTAHAGLLWSRTQAYFALDRPIISPDMPTSLTATAVPALAWSGNLWTWNPQAVITQNLSRPGSAGVELQAALIDVGDAPLTPVVPPTSTATSTGLNSAEQSSKPGVEARIALVGPDRDDGHSHIGVGGYFAPHVSSLGRNFDSWAGTLDVRFPLVARLELSGNFYRGAALGGLGGGGYKDFAYKPNLLTGGFYFRLLDDVGGWAQLKEKVNERLEFNAVYGMDDVFAGELQRYYVPGGSTIQNLARNRTYTGNVIYSPSAYLLFSLEFRHLESIPIEDSPNTSNIIGLGAGYRF
jgi:hypothetical protein